MLIMIVVRVKAMREVQLLYWLSLLSVHGIGVKKARQLYGKVSTYEAAKQYGVHDWLSCGLNMAQAESLYTALKNASYKREMTRIMDKYQFVLEDDPYYPALLREIAIPPPMLFYKGPLSHLQRSVAIVGTRKCTSYGKKVAFESAQMLANGDCCVVSGLALGIDEAAHKGAIAGRGCTYAVLGSGIDHIYPPQNTRLAEQIIESGGVILSEFLPWTKPERYRFPQRNRIISGMSKGVIIVEAGARSGALITASYALEQNRDVYAVPGSVYSLASSGTNELIASGAVPLLHPAAILHTLNLIPILEREAPKRSESTEDEFGLVDGVIKQWILQELMARSMSREELMAAREEVFSVSEIDTAIIFLEISQMIRRSMDGTYQMVPNDDIVS